MEDDGGVGEGVGEMRMNWFGCARWHTAVGVYLLCGLEGGVMGAVSGWRGLDDTLLRLML